MSKPVCANKGIGWLFWPVPLLIVAFYLIPFLGVVTWSVSMPEVGLDNYARIATDANIRDVIFRTLRICLLVSLVATVLAYLLAFTWVFSNKRWRFFVEIGVFLPFWLSVLVRTFGWLIALKSNGPVNNLLMMTGLIDSPLQLTRNELGVTIGTVHFLIPFAFFPLLQALQRVDQRIVLAARGLGAGRLRTFWQVFFPQTVSGVLGAFIMVFVFAVGFFIIPVLLGGGQTVMIAEYIFLQMFQTSNWGLGAALSIVVLLVVGLLSWILVKYVKFGSVASEEK
ncbi:ABC transporter permease [Pseudomonas sp. R3-56]|uniref:ABC transporter permease n=1 Tax=Pseudomonas sp. R3-56 TaxID=2817401 RepID=UPI003DA7F845